MDSVDGFMSRLGMATMMFWSEPNPPPLSDMLALFRSAGMRFVDWSHLSKQDRLCTPAEMDEYAELLQDNGLRCQQVHGFETKEIPILSQGDVLERYIAIQSNRVELCHRLGGDAVVLHPPRHLTAGTFVGGARMPIREALERSMVPIDRLRPLCEKLGVTLAIENSGMDPYNRERFDFYFERYPADFITFCLDTGHANMNGQVEELQVYGERLAALHLHDNKQDKDAHQPPFSGTVNWAGVMAWLRRISYRRSLCFEIHYDRSLFAGSPAEFVADATQRIHRAVALANTDGDNLSQRDDESNHTGVPYADF